MVYVLILYQVKPILADTIRNVIKMSAELEQGKKWIEIGRWDSSKD